MGRNFLIGVKKKLKPLYTLAAALLLAAFVVPVGIVWNIIKFLYHLAKGDFKKSFRNAIAYWGYMLYQAWNVIKYLLNRLSVAIDLFGNVSSGEFIEDCVTDREATLFGDGKVTISAAIGHEQVDHRLVRFGRRFSNTLSRVFEPNHCLNAEEKRMLLKKFDEQKNIDFI